MNDDEKEENDIFENAFFQQEPSPLRPEPPPLAPPTPWWQPIRDWFVGIEIFREKNDPKTIIIGPTNSGKTTLISAFKCVCSQYRPNQKYTLSWLYGSSENAKATKNLIKKPVQVIMGSTQQEGTSKVEEYTFIVEGHKNHSSKGDPLFSIPFHVFDGPGGAIFSTDSRTLDAQADHRETLVEALSKSDNLLICFDSNARNIELAQLSIDNLRGEIKELMPKARYLPFQRVLILLNKIDSLCRDTLRARGEREMSAKDLADIIDPFAQARHLIGQPLLDDLFKSIHPKAKLAIGVSSAWGFKPDGSPLFKKTGDAVKAPQGEDVDTNDFLEMRAPYGLYEALVFLAKGEVLPPLHRVQRSDFKSFQEQEVLD